MEGQAMTQFFSLTPNLKFLTQGRLVDPLWLSFSLSENHLKFDDLTFPLSNSVEMNDGRQRSVLLYELFLSCLLRKDRLVCETTDLPIKYLDKVYFRYVGYSDTL